MGEDWDATCRILKIQEALLNYATVLGALWSMDPTLLVLLCKLLMYNYNAGHGDEERE